MTTVTTAKIPDGSYEVRVFGGDDVPGESAIETVLVLRNCGDAVCEVSLAHGHLYNEANMLIALKAYELGFRTLKFHALKGAKVTRWAEKVGDDDVFNYFEAYLPSVITRMAMDKRL
jgi:hypothetical protein